MARILIIVAQRGFRDEEYTIPKGMLEREGHQISVASLGRANATGVGGTVVKPDFAAHEVSPDFFDMVVIVGGPNSPTLAADETVINLVRKMNRNGKWVAGICLGGLTLAAAGAFHDKKATIFPDMKAIRALRDGGGLYEPRSTVVDGNIITSDGPEHAEEFGMMLVEKLKGKQ